MTVTGQSAWRSIGDLTPAQFTAQIKAGSPMLADADAIYAAVKGYSALYDAHAKHESEWGMTGEGANTADHNALGNKDHVNGGYMHFATWAEGAAWWKQHVSDPNGYYAQTHTIADYVSIYAPASDGNDEARYVQVICEVANMVTTPPTPAPAPPPTPGFKLYAFPGLNRQVPLPAWITVIIANPLPDGPNLTNHTPSSAFVKSTWHDTGNDTTNAADEYAWLKAGRPGGEPGDYSGIFDDTTIYITSRFDEDVWHAGTPVGNHTSYGFEQAYGGSVDFNQSLKVGAALHGGLCAALGWDVATALVTHQFWYGKYCPRQILDKGIWPQVVQMTKDAAAAAAAFLGGVLPPSAYAPKHPLPPKTVVGANATVYWYNPQTLTTTTAATPREYADPAATATGATIAARTTVNLSHVCIGADAALWVVGTGGSRLPATAFV